MRVSNFWKVDLLTACIFTRWIVKVSSAMFFRNLATIRRKMILTSANSLGSRVPYELGAVSWSLCVRYFGRPGPGATGFARPTGGSFPTGDGATRARHRLVNWRTTTWYYWVHTRVKKSCWTCGVANWPARNKCSRSLSVMWQEEKTDMDLRLISYDPRIPTLMKHMFLIQFASSYSFDQKHYTHSFNMFTASSMFIDWSLAKPHPSPLANHQGQ